MVQFYSAVYTKFTGGNFATITLLYDWMFGTLDDGQGYGKFRVEKKAKPVAEGAVTDADRASAMAG